MMKWITHISLLLLLCSFSTHAGLIRGAGKGVETSSNSTSYYRISDSFYIDGLGVDIGFSGSRSSFVAGVYPLTAVPQGCKYYASYDVLEFFTDDPCYYQFEQGERLLLEGFMQAYVPDAADFAIEWNIVQGANSWLFSGADTRHDGEMFYLDALMPATMLPGEFSVELSITQFAGDGFSFYLDSDVHNDDLNCDNVNKDDPDSFACAYGWSRSQSITFNSPTERLLILATPPASIPAPASIGLFMLGCCWLRRKHG